jgi:hypothetical protein
MRQALIFGAVGTAVIEILSSLILNVPWVIGGGFALAFLALTFWYTRNGSRVALWGLAVLLFLEFVNVPFYERPDTKALILQVIAGLVALLGLVGAIGVIVQTRRDSRVERLSAAG